MTDRERERERDRDRGTDYFVSGARNMEYTQAYYTAIFTGFRIMVVIFL